MPRIIAGLLSLMLGSSAVLAIGASSPHNRHNDQQFDGLIGAAARQQGLEPALIKAVIKCESNFNPQAVSAKGAQGLMQLMPTTQATLGVADAFVPHHNIQAGTRYLSLLRQTFGTRTPLLLAAYNAGPQAVIKAGYEVPNFTETQRYVACVERARRRYQAHGFNALFASLAVTPGETEPTHALIVTPPRLTPAQVQPGERLLLHIDAWNTGLSAAHGVVSLTYPTANLSYLALTTTPGDTAVHVQGPPAVPPLQDSNAAPSYRVLQSAWPTWQPGQRRTATLSLAPRHDLDLALHLSVLLYNQTTSTEPQRWSVILRLPIQPQQKTRQEHGSP